MRRHLPRFLLVGGLLLSSPLSAQSRQELTLEASVFKGTVGYAHAVAPGVRVGGELGFGFPQMDQTLTPSAGPSGEPNLREYLHAALFVRQRVTRVVTYDVGVRAAVVDLWPCTASDCWPTGFLGAFLQPMIGGRRLSVGPRLVAGWAWESESARRPTFTAAVAPVNVRFTFDW